MEGWKDGVLERWNDGMMEWWRNEVLKCWSAGRMEGWSVGILPACRRQGVLEKAHLSFLTSVPFALRPVPCALSLCYSNSIIVKNQNEPLRPQHRAF